MNEKIEIKHNNKTYEIDKDAKEQKVRPKGVDFKVGDAETEENKEVTFTNYQESFWETSMEAEGQKIEIKWGAGKYLTAAGVPTSGAVVIIGALLYKYFKSPVDKLTDTLNEVIEVKEELKKTTKKGKSQEDKL